MTKFSDQLFDDLMREHGPALAPTTPPAPVKRQVTARRTVLAAGGGLAVAGAVAAVAAGTLVAGGATPAYAVTKNPDGTVTLAVYQKSGFAEANARLHQLDEGQVVVVPVEPGCPTLGSLPAPPVSGKGRMMSMSTGRSQNGTISVSAQGIPAGDILVVGIQTTAHGTAGESGLTSAPAPSCLSPFTMPPGNGGSGSARVGGA
jgi:hypothetical protein